METDIELYKPNELIGAIDQIEVSRTAKHLLNFFLQYAQQEIKFNNHQGFEFEVDVMQINGLADIHTHDYERLKKSLIKLIQPVILRDDPKHFMALAPVTSIDIDVPNGLYKFELQPKVVKLLEQTDYFTKLHLSEFNPLQSKHSIVIFEWLKRYENAPKIPKISMEELRKITNTSDVYPNFTDFQKRVLEVAVKEISKHTDYTVSYTAIKGKARTRLKVSEIQFEFKRKKLDVIDAEVVEKQVSSDELERISIAEAISEAQEVLNKHFRSDDSYRLQCNYFLSAFLCTEEEYYRATQLINYKALSWWLENKKTTSLKYFIGDVKTGQRKGRFKDRIEFYKTMLGHLRPEQQELFKEAESRLGFKSLLDRVLELLRDSRKLDDSWL
jgi:hypothetical protein